MYLSMHNNGHVKNQPQERHLENFDGLLHSLHCGNTKLPLNRKVHHSFVELDLGHVIVEELLELVAAWSQGRPNRTAAPRISARPAPPPPPRTIREPTLGLPGAAQDRCNIDRRIALYGLGRRRSTDKSSRQLLRRECYPSLDSSRCPCRTDWLTPSFTSQL